MAEAQLADAVHAAQRTDFRSRLPLRPSRWALATVGVLTLAMVLSLVLPNAQEGVLLQRDAIRAAIEEQIEDLEAVKEQVAETEGLTEAESEALLQELEEAIANLEEGRATPEEALAALSEAEQALAELQDPGAAGLEEGLEEAGEQVSDSELTKDLAEALAQSDYQAAAEALVFPVEAHITALLPASNALAMATTMPLSLNEPVGLHPSSLRYNSPQPISFSSPLHLTKGVSPSPSEYRGVSEVIGRKSLYLNRTPDFDIKLQPE